jgi:hypothetical protein
MKFAHATLIAALAATAVIAHDTSFDHQSHHIQNIQKMQTSTTISTTNTESAADKKKWND